VAILTPVFTYLATIGLKWPDTTREMIITAVSVGLGLLTAFLHSTSNAPVSTSPLAADIERAKADLAAAHAAREQAQEPLQEPPHVDPGAVPPAQPVQTDVPVTPVIRPDPALIIEPDYEEEPDVPTNEIDIFDEEGNIDLTRITVAQLISIRKQLPAILAPLGPEPLSEPRLPTVSEFAAIHPPAGHDSDTSNRR
jgi:hypothetical protein